MLNFRLNYRSSNAVTRALSLLHCLPKHCSSMAVTYLDPRLNDIGHTPPRCIVITIVDKIFQHVGSNAHSTIINIDHSAFGKSGMASEARGQDLCKNIRKLFAGTLSTTFWQVNLLNSHQIHFQCTRVPDANACMLFNMLIQSVIQFIASFSFLAKSTESTEPVEIGYELMNAYCTCTPDAKKVGLQTNTHFLIFKRCKSRPIEILRDSIARNVNTPQIVPNKAAESGNLPKNPKEYKKRKG